MATLVRSKEREDPGGEGGKPMYDGAGFLLVWICGVTRWVLGQCQSQAWAGS